jgi:hypothetical protein
LESDSRSEVGDDNLDNIHALRTLDGEQVGHDTLDLDILPAPCNRSADKLENGSNDGDSNGIDNTTFPYPAKRQRSTSPRREPNLPRTSIPPLLDNEDVERSTENIDDKDSDESGDDNFWSKRRKLSDSLGSRTTLSSQKEQSQHSPSSISDDLEDDGADGAKGSSVDDKIASTVRTTPDVFKPAPPTEPQLCPEAIDANRDWEVREIIGKEYVDGVLHYMVEWCPTLEPVHSLDYAKELVDEFEARLLALRKDKEQGVGPCIKRDSQAVMGAEAPGGRLKKGRWGRPRKQK